MAKTPTYIAVDIEADGPIPGVNSMLALGSVAYSDKGVELGSFEVNLLPLDGGVEYPSTMKFWAEHPEAWARIRQDLQTPQEAISHYLAWLGSFAGQVIAITKPKGFDFMWVYWYMRRFVGKCPFGWDCIDLRSYVSGRQKLLYKNTLKQNLPEEWFSHVRHTHIPVEDARDLGETWWKIVGKRREVRSPEPVAPTTATIEGWQAALRRDLEDMRQRQAADARTAAQIRQAAEANRVRRGNTITFNRPIQWDWTVDNPAQ